MLDSADLCTYDALMPITLSMPEKIADEARAAAAAANRSLSEITRALYREWLDGRPVGGADEGADHKDKK